MELADLCREISNLCKIGNEPKWENLFLFFLSKIEDGEIGSTKSEIRRIYGGMGSFNDLVLQKNGSPLIGLNEKLDSLREVLYDQVTN